MAKNENDLNASNRPSMYTEVTISDVKEILIKNILKSQYGRDDEVDSKIRAAWKERFKESFRPVRMQGEMPLPLLHGQSAIGKSRIIDSACLEVANMLGMTPLFNPKGRRKFTNNEMVIGKLNFKASGDVPFLLVGMVSIDEQELDDGTKASYTSTTPNDIVYSVSKNAGAGIRVLFVDEVNSGDVASAAFMALHDNDLGSDIDVGDTFMVGAGNLGEDDGNLASANPVSMSTRAWNFMVMPNFDSWVKDFVEPNYLSDEVGDFGVSLYLQLNPEKFNEKPPKASEIEGVSTVYGAARTWSHLITTLETQYGSSEALGNAGIDKISNLAAGIVGPSGRGFAEFANALWTGVIPLVEQYMSKEGPSAATIRRFEERMGEARGAKERDFMYQWSHQCAVTAGSRIVRELSEAGYSRGFDASADKSRGEAKANEVREIFRDVGRRFGRAMGSVKSSAMINSSGAGVVNHMTRIATTVLPWLRESGGLKGMYRSDFLSGAMEELAKAGISKSGLENLSRIYFGNRLERPDHKKPDSPLTL